MFDGFTSDATSLQNNFLVGTSNRAKDYITSSAIFYSHFVEVSSW